MKLNKRIAIASGAVLLGSLALGGVAQAANGAGAGHQDHKRTEHSKTVEAPAGTKSVPAKKIQPASKDNKYSQTIKADANTPHIDAGRVDASK
ncbi:hypothetical protein [Streptomyces sp. NBC_01304]|uniref:hypothetical protein n=1 Tax=Streptomyces sp. NBC_01304 TaxID=2903818 RepID=UPI002E0EE656|nr:hypothetical protein OG430_44040 [Streptomyces sp. NBC_01304]